MAFTLQPGQETGIATLQEQRDAQIAALRRELLGYERSGKTERAAQVKAEIKQLGAEVDDKPKGRSKATVDKDEDAEQATA